MQSDLTELRERAESLETAHREEALAVAALRTELEEARIHRDQRVATAVRRRRQIIGMIAGFAAVAVAAFAVIASIPRDGSGERLQGQVLEVRGDAPADVGDGCTVRIDRGFFFWHDVTVDVDCGGQRLYGFAGVGALTCLETDGRVTRCDDARSIAEDGDPRLVYDSGEGQIMLDDGDRWQVVIALVE